MNNIRVLLFGSFDPLHEGHIDLFRQAKSQGAHLTVVVDRDSTIRTFKKREPHQAEAARLLRVQSIPDVDEARLGDKDPHTYRLLTELSFDVLALGYDQQPADDEVARLLANIGKPHVTIMRLMPHEPKKYKSSYLRP